MTRKDARFRAIVESLGDDYAPVLDGLIRLHVDTLARKERLERQLAKVGAFLPRFGPDGQPMQVRNPLGREIAELGRTLTTQLRDLRLAAQSARQNAVEKPKVEPEDDGEPDFLTLFVVYNTRLLGDDYGESVWEDEAVDEDGQPVFTCRHVVTGTRADDCLLPPDHPEYRPVPPDELAAAGNGI